MADMDLSILAGKFKQLRKMRDRLKSKETKRAIEAFDHYWNDQDPEDDN